MRRSGPSLGEMASPDLAELGNAMTQPLTMERFAEAPERRDVPSVAGPIVARSLLASRLDVGISGVLTVVTAPQGAGKTTGVATWASAVSQRRGLVWLDLAEARARPASFVPALVDAFVAAGLAGLPRLGLANLAHRSRRRAVLTAVAEAVQADGPWILVLDDFPSGQDGQLGADMEFLLAAADRSLRVVLLTDGTPAMALHRFRLAGELTRIDSSDLDLTTTEIAQLLLAHGVEPVDGVVAAVLAHSRGWAAGARLACRSVAVDPVDAAMAITDAAIEDYLVAEVIEPLPPAVRLSLFELSLVDVAPAGLVGSLISNQGAGALSTIAEHTAFVSVGLDGAARVHPILRRVASRALSQESPQAARAARIRAAQWFVDNGEQDRGFVLAEAAEDWSWIGRTLVQQLGVADVLAGTGSSWATRTEVVEQTPFLRAAVEVSSRQLHRARAARELVPAAGTEVERLSLDLLDLEIAVLSCDASTGHALVGAVREQLAASAYGLRSRAEITALVDTDAGLLALVDGDLDTAARTLAAVPATGHLALVEAARGNLNAALVLCKDFATSAEQLGARAGVAEADLARTWVSVERLQLGEARYALDRARTEQRSSHPLTAALLDLVDARWHLAAGRPEAAARLASASAARDDRGSWPGDLARVVLARAWLAQREFRRALATLTPEPARAPVESRVVSAAASAGIGDLRGARALLAATASDLVDAPLAVQLDCWLLEARLAAEEGDDERAHRLVERALRNAQEEGMRTPIGASAAWIRRALGRDASLHRTYRDFVSSLSTVETSVVGAALPSTGHRTDQVVEPLSERETQVLELLALMCSTDEIAAELFVSGNTVKTHVKSIFRKLGVNRRVDAVRVGRAQGIC